MTTQNCKAKDKNNCRFHKTGTYADPAGSFVAAAQKQWASAKEATSADLKAQFIPLDENATVEDYSQNFPTYLHFPKSVGEARALVKNIRGDKDHNGFDSVRRVVLNSKSLPDELQVYGPKDGRPLVLSIHSGFGKIQVKSGNVVIEADSNSGNVIEASGSSNVIVIDSGNRKITSKASENATLTLVPGEESWGSVEATDNAKVSISKVSWPHSYRIIQG